MLSGKKQFTLLAVAGAIFALVTIAGLAGNVVRGNYLAIPLVIVILLLAIGVIAVGIWLNQRRIQMLYRKPTPDLLIEHYQTALLQARVRKVPHADAVAAHLSALAAATYGQFDRARKELAAIAWENTPAMYQRNHLFVLALISLLESEDEAGARKLTAEADTLRGAESTEPHSVLGDAVVLAAGGDDAALIKRVERGAAPGVGALPALSAWALSRYAARTGQAEAVERYRAQAREAAPHFVGLKQTARES